MIIPLGIGAVPYGILTHVWHTAIEKKLLPCVPRRLVTDSREVEAKDLFCALKGKDDGHKYTAEAAKRGAAAVLAERPTDAPVPHILVPSVKDALGQWAAHVSDGDGFFRIGITGSVGKTTLKNAVSAMLSPFFALHATYKNYNNDLGLPFTLLSAPKGSNLLVCEIGINQPGEMRKLSAILRPHLSVITCIGHAHIGALGSREGIAKEKIDILFSAAQGGTVLVPVGEPLLAFLPPHGIRRCAISPWNEENYRRYGLSPTVEDTPRGFALGYAEAIGELLSLSGEQKRLGLSLAYACATRRKEEQHENLLIIDDGYNASPESMLSALCYLSEKAAARRVAVLGDMLELGEDSEIYHRAIGRFAASHADLLIFFGAYAKEYAQGARAAGASPTRSEGACQFLILEGDKTDMARNIAALLAKDDTLLFKASRAIEIEKIIDALKDVLSMR